MKLKPLEQWYCDTCGEVILAPSHGYIEWVREDFRPLGFRIVHAAPYSPKHGSPRCYSYQDATHRADVPLESMIGAAGLPLLLSLLDHGPLQDPEGKRVPQTTDIRGWTELFRRLHSPYYEEARRYFEQAKEDGYFDDMNEYRPYMPDLLRRLISEYEED